MFHRGAIERCLCLMVFASAVHLAAPAPLRAAPMDSILARLIPVDSTSNLVRRLQWFGLRRMTESGSLPRGILERALERKERQHFASLFLNTAPLEGGCAWISLGPRNVNGRVKCLAVHPTNGGILYAGSAAGGVWKTTDGGESWKPMMSTQRSLAIGALAIDPIDPNTIYAGTGEPVYREDVLGEPGLNAWSYEGAGIYRSTDGGANWTRMPVGNDYIYRIAIDPFDHTRVLCAGFSAAALDPNNPGDPGAGGLCLLEPGGTWSTILSGIFTDVDFDPQNSGVIYAAQYNEGIWKFEGTDLTSPSDWVRMNAGLPSPEQMRRISMAIAPSDWKTRYALIEYESSSSVYGRFYRTRNDSDWVETVNPSVYSSIPYASFVAVDPNHSDRVYTGGLDLVRSEIGGGFPTIAADLGNWSKVNARADGSVIHVDHHDLVFVNSDEFYLANDGGVLRGVSSEGGASVVWTKISTGLAVTQFYDVTVSHAIPTMIAGGTQDNGTLVTTGGMSWRHVLQGDGGHVVFHPLDGYTMWGQSCDLGRFVIERTNDGWQSAAVQMQSDTTVFPAGPLVGDPNDAEILFVGTDAVLRSGDAGESWHPVSPEVDADVRDVFTEIAIAPQESNVLYAGTLRGRLFRATNGGITGGTPDPASFTELLTPPPQVPRRWISGIAIHPEDVNTIYVSYLQLKDNTETDPESDHIWKVQQQPSGDWLWEKRSDGLEDVPAGAVLMASDLTLYAGTDIGVFRSLDDGRNWEPFEQGLPTVPIFDLALSTTEDKLFAATHGRGMYQIQLEGCCCPVDIYLRDNILDTGEVVPSPSGVEDPTNYGANVYFYKSADIKVESDPFVEVGTLLDGVEFDNIEHRTIEITTAGGDVIETVIELIDGLTHEKPVRGQTNKVRVQVHNRGPQPARDVVAMLLFADAGAGLPLLPEDFWDHFPAGGFDTTHWEAIGSSRIIQVLEPQIPKVLEWDWDVPGTISNHACLLAMIHNSQDPLLPQSQRNVGLLTHNNKHVTQRNVHPVDPMSPNVLLSLQFHNPYAKTTPFDVAIREISPACTEVWLIVPEMELESPLSSSLRGLRQVDHDQITELVQAARESRLFDDRTLRLLERPFHVFQVTNRDSTAAIRGVRLTPREGLVGLIGARIDPRAEKGVHLFDVTQSEKGKLVGGSEAILGGRQ